MCASSDNPVCIRLQLRKLILRYRLIENKMLFLFNFLMIDQKLFTKQKYVLDKIN